jgi:endonuclease/exonuclease/phosphatase family metal-dependent hydrolase
VTWNIKVDQTAIRARQEMDLLAALTPLPDVIVLNEANYSNVATYMQELETQTHRTWSWVFQRHCQPNGWNTATSSCGSLQDEGVAILTTLTIRNYEGTYFPWADCWHSARGGLRAAVEAGSAVVQIFAAHLQTGGCQNDAQSRLASIAHLKAWASGFSSPQLVGGDFNAVPSSTEIVNASRGMAAAFVDAWSIAGFGNGYTFDSANPPRRIDYWFSNGASVRTVSVPLSSSSLSDHSPVRASFAVGE